MKLLIREINSCRQCPCYRRIFEHLGNGRHARGVCVELNRDRKKQDIFSEWIDTNLHPRDGIYKDCPLPNITENPNDNGK